MKENSLKQILWFFIPWLVLFVSGGMLSIHAHPSLRFFTIGFGITSFITLLLLWWSGTGEIAKTAKSVLIAMVAISLKMFTCAIILVYYFHHHPNEKEPAILTGSLLFLFFTTLEVVYGIKMSKNTENPS